MKTTIIIIFITLSFSCKRPKEHVISKWNIPIVMDSIPKSHSFFETKKIRNPFNQPIYIGTKNDTIPITKTSLNINLLYSETQNDNDTLSDSRIEIIPDPTQELSIDMENYSYPPPPVLLGGDEFEIDKNKTDSIFEIWKKRPRNYVKAYPVFIRNTTNDIVHIDNQDGILFLIQEAKTKSGAWKPIEYWKYSTCGNSYATTSIGASDILIIKKIKYTGSFKTQLRFKLKTNNRIVYSKPFDGSINIEQFDVSNVDGWTKKKAANKEYLNLTFLNN